MSRKNISRELVVFAAMLVVWSLVGLVILGTVFVGLAFCGRVVIGYFNLGKNADVYFWCFDLITSALIMFVLLRWDGRHRFTRRSAEAVAVYFRQKK
jgi:hypothetical protein